MRSFAFLPMLLAATVLSVGSSGAADQSEVNMVRLSRLVIDEAQLDAYRAALKEEIEASVKLEPGVLTLYAISEKVRPTHFTILEIYADRAAYDSHIKSTHFRMYKTGTEGMVKSLELIDAVSLVPSMKIK